MLIDRPPVIIRIDRGARRSGLPSSPGRKTVLHPGGNFAAELRALREELGWTRLFLAELIGLDQSSIYKLENGLRHPTLPTVTLLAEAFDLYGSAGARLYVAVGYIPPGWSACREEPHRRAWALSPVGLDPPGVVRTPDRTSPF